MKKYIYIILIVISFLFLGLCIKYYISKDNINEEIIEETTTRLPYTSNYIDITSNYIIKYNNSSIKYNFTKDAYNNEIKIEGNVITNEGEGFIDYVLECYDKDYNLVDKLDVTTITINSYRDTFYNYLYGIDDNYNKISYNKVKYYKIRLSKMVIYDE